MNNGLSFRKYIGAFTASYLVLFFLGIFLDHYAGIDLGRLMGKEKVKKHRKYILFGIAALVVFGLGAKTYRDMHLQYNGVCLEKGRPLTDDEKIRAVLEEMNRSPMRSVNFVSYKRVPFSSADQFLKDNPNCCTVEVRETQYNGNSWDDSKALGVYAGHVIINYTLHYLDEHGVEQQTADRMEFTIQNCGVVN